MTKQEEIRNYTALGKKLWLIDLDVEKILLDVYKAGRVEADSISTIDNAKTELMAKLHSQGVALKVEGELYASVYKTLCESFPLPFRMTDDEIADLAKWVVDDMREAGYTLTEDLI